MWINLLYALLATVGTWLITALGAGVVLFFKNPGTRFLNIMLGFAAGVMIAAAFWSLLEPAIVSAKEIYKTAAYFVVTGGFLCGAVFIWVSDKIVTKATNKAYGGNTVISERFKRVILLVLSITIHNIPEGLAVGVAFGAAGSSGTREAFAGAISIAVGIGLQNFPEGAAVSLPLRKEGLSRKKSFIIGQASAIVEPVAGVIGAALVVFAKMIMPFALSFAAGAMILVAVHELIPECQKNKAINSYGATAGIIIGFAVMMLLDIML